MRPAFTLIELVAVSIIILLACLVAAPALHALLIHGQASSAIQAFSGALTAAQAAAQSNFTTAALRIERAFQIDPQGQMIKDASGNPRWLDHQQMRVLVFGTRQGEYPVSGEEYSFRPLQTSHLTPLPPLAWLAPDYALDPTRWAAGQLAPANSTDPRFDALDTFHIVFNRRGEMVRATDKLTYLDQTQANVFVDYAYAPVRSVTLYNRQVFEESGRDPARLGSGAPLYVNRYSASLVQGRLSGS